MKHAVNGAIACFAVALILFVPSQLSAHGLRANPRAGCFAICGESFCEKSGTICVCSCENGQAKCSCGVPAE